MAKAVLAAIRADVRLEAGDHQDGLRWLERAREMASEVAVESDRHIERVESKLAALHRKE